MDAARGLALIGMTVAHTLYAPGETIFDGRSSILFATVAGISLGLLSGGADPVPREARRTARISVLIRGVVLVLLGLAFTALLQPPIIVILDYYGIAFLLLIGPLFLRRRWLLAIAAAAAIAGPLVVSAVTAATDSRELALPLRIVLRWMIDGGYPLAVWLAYLLVGIVLARSDLRDRFTAAIALVVGTLAAVVGYAAAALVPGIDASAHSDTTAEVVASGGVAVAIVGAFSLLDSTTGASAAPVRFLRVVLSPLAAVGSMALTLYVVQAVALTIVREAVSVGDRWAMPPWALPVLVVGSLVVATLWRRVVGSGPLEAGLRMLTRLARRRGPRVAP